MLVAAITLALALLRFAWVWASLRLTLLRARDKQPFRGSKLRLVAAFSFAGVRGTITLAGILTLPLTMPGGAPFPGRDFAIFLSAAVILLSLVGASVVLPLLLNGLVLPDDDDAAERERDVREAVSRAAVRAIETAGRAHADDADGDAYARAARRIADIYRSREAPRDAEATRDREHRTRIETEMRLAGLGAARDEALRLAHSGEASSLLARRLIREIDLMEIRFSG